MEFEFDIWPDESNSTSSNNYVMFWMDGVPSNIVAYSHDSELSQGSDAAVPITIGSNDCDVYVYLVKAYEKHLNDTEHLNNFILD